MLITLCFCTELEALGIVYVTVCDYLCNSYDYVTAYEPEMEFRRVCRRGMGWTLECVYSQEAEGILGGCLSRGRRNQV